MTRVKSTQPALHADQHLPEGSDPIPGLLVPPVPVDYPGMILAHPCLVHYWPCDETSGNLIDRKGTWDMGRVTHMDIAGNLWPQYGYEGPFSTMTAVVNSGGEGDHGRFTHSSMTGGDLGVPYTIEMWLTLNGIEGYPLVVTNLLALHVGAGGPNPGKLVAQHGDTSIVTLVDGEAMPVGAWQHIAIRHDGTTVELWRNGFSRDYAASTGLIDAAGELAWLNTPSASTAAAWNGGGGHLAFYNCALDDATIIAHSRAPIDLENAGDAGDVPRLTDDGTVDWGPAPVSVEDPPGTPARYERILFGDGLVATDNLDNTVTIDATGGDPATATTWWFPLVDADGTCVLDASGALIPTLIPL